MKAIGIAAILLGLAACGQATPSATTSPTPSSPMVAILQATNTVAIVGLDGRQRASATFDPLPVPTTACMGAVIPAYVHVAAGRVYYADAKGVVKSLAPDGKTATITTFPVTSSQEMLSFAVSPDGGRLLATVFTIPKDAVPCNGSSSSGTFTFDTYVATAGAAAKLVSHETWMKPQGVLALRGWDSIGPFGIYPDVWATQGGGPGSTLGPFVRVDASTVKPGLPFSAPTECRTWDSVDSGAFVCTIDPVMVGAGVPTQKAAVSVRGANGAEIWRLDMWASSPILAPDGNHVVMTDTNAGSELLASRDQTQSKLPASFVAEDWIDSRIAIGSYSGTLAYVDVTSPTTVVPLNLSGQVIGPLGG